VVIDAASGGVLAMDSLPTYDPTTLDDTWDRLRADPSAPLLNRATQALYQPGSVLQSVVLGEAVNNGAIRPQDAWSGRTAGRFQGASLPCASNQVFAVQTYADAFMWGCPGAIQSLGGLLGLDDLKRSYSDFGLEEAPPFDLPVAVCAQPTEDDPETAAIGQGRLTVTPLHMALVAAAFANHGQMPAPRLVSAIRPPGQGWQPTPTSATPRGTISSASADMIKALMQQAVESGAAHAASSTQRRIYGYTGLALTGPGFNFNTWFVGFTYDDSDRPVAIAILLEGSQDAERAARIGGQLLAEAAILLKN
jgi:peptidoglycan glycosyltransferase